MPSNKKLTDHDIGDLVMNTFNSHAHVSDLRAFNDMRPHLKNSEISKHLAMLKNHPVIELGYGRSPLYLMIECAAYTGVDPYPYMNNWTFPKPPKAKFVQEDALIFLRTQRPLSAIIVSFGLLDESILGPLNELDSDRKKRALQYQEELAENIRTVAHPFALLYGADTEKIMGKPDIPFIPSHTRLGGIYLPYIPKAA